MPWLLPIPKARRALPGCTAWGNRGFSLQAGAAARGDLGEEDSQRVFLPPPPRADCLLVGSLKINPSWRRSALFPPQMASSNPAPWQRLLLIFSVGTHPGGCPDLARPWDILRTRGPARPCSHPRRAALGRKRRRRRDGGSWQAPQGLPSCCLSCAGCLSSSFLSWRWERLLLHPLRGSKVQHCSRAWGQPCPLPKLVLGEHRLAGVLQSPALPSSACCGLRGAGRAVVGSLLSPAAPRLHPRSWAGRDVPGTHTHTHTHRSGGLRLCCAPVPPPQSRAHGAAPSWGHPHAPDPKFGGAEGSAAAWWPGLRRAVPLPPEGAGTWSCSSSSQVPTAGDTACTPRCWRDPFFWGGGYRGAVLQLEDKCIVAGETRSLFYFVIWLYKCWGIAHSRVVAAVQNSTAGSPLLWEPPRCEPATALIAWTPPLHGSALAWLR